MCNWCLWLQPYKVACGDSSPTNCPVICRNIFFVQLQCFFLLDVELRSRIGTERFEPFYICIISWVVNVKFWLIWLRPNTASIFVTWHLCVDLCITTSYEPQFLMHKCKILYLFGHVTLSIHIKFQMHVTSIKHTVATIIPWNWF